MPLKLKAKMCMCKYKVKLMMQRIQPAPAATCVMKKVETFDMQVLLLCGNFTFPIINFVLNKPQ